MLNEKIIKQLDVCLTKAKETGFAEKYHMGLNPDEAKVAEINQMLISVVDRLAGPKSSYQKSVDSELKKIDIDNSYLTPKVYGIVRALKGDYESGYFESVAELIHADVFSDFLEMADHLLMSGFKDPAAVLIGGVLEEHLRKLSLKTSIPIKNGKDFVKADKLNSDLAKAEVYNALEMKNVTAWLDLRNKAAHGKYSEYDKENVSLMLAGVSNFLFKFTA